MTLLVQREKHQCVVLKVLTFTFHKFLYGVLFLDSSMVEHSAVNRVVVGSSPVGPIRADVAQLAEQLICNQQVVGSTPTVGSLDL